MARTFEFQKEKTALVIVDMQNDFVREGAPMRVDATHATIEPIKKLIAFARENKMAVIFTRFISGKTPTLLWNWSPEIATHNNCVRGFERHYTDVGRALQCSDVIDELKPILPEDYIVDKYHYSAFRNTNLIDVLRSEGADTIIVTGTVTQICVEDTVHDGFAEGFKVLVASDCVSTWDELQQKAALENFANKYGMVMSSEEIMQAM